VEVSLDIFNAFNTMSWDPIRRALEFHDIPPYAYMGDPNLSGLLVGQMARVQELEWDPCAEGCRGVPQGSILGLTCGTSGTMSCLGRFFFLQAARSSVADETVVLAARD